MGRTRGAGAGREGHPQGVVWQGGGKAAAGQVQDEVGRQRTPYYWGSGIGKLRPWIGVGGRT